MAGQAVEYLLRLVDEASEPLEDVAASAEKAEVSTAQLGAQLAVLGGTLGAVATAWVALNQTVADGVNDLNDMATRTGVAADTLAGMKIAIEGAGGSLEELEMGLQRMVRQGEDLETFAARLAEIEDPTERAALAMETFGRAGGKMLQSGFLDDMDHFVALAREEGLDIGPEASAQAAEWQRSMALLDATMESIPQRLLEAFGGDGAAAMAQFTEDLNELLDIADQVVDPVTRIGDAVDTAYQRMSLFLPLFTDLRDVARSFSEVDFGQFADLFASGGTFTFPTAPAPTSGTNTRENPITRGGTGTNADIAAGADRADAAAAAAAASGSGGPQEPDPDPYVIPIVDQIDAMGFVIEQTAAVNVDAINAQSASIEAGYMAELEKMDEIARAEAEARDANFAQLGADLSMVGGMMAGGDLVGMLGMAGPQGAAIAGGLQGLEMLGNSSPEEIEAQARGQIEAIERGLEMLPAILGDVLPDVIIDAVPALTLALIEAFPKLIAAQAEMFARLTVELPIEFGKAMLEALFGWWEQIKDFFKPGGDFSEKTTGEKALLAGRVTLALATMGLSEAAIFAGKKAKQSFDTGTRYVSETGMAMVHQRERIYAPGQSGPMGGGLTVVLENNGVMVQGGVDGLVREIRERLGDLGYGDNLTAATVG